MSDYKKSETRQILEEIYSGKYPVRGSDGREYYVRYNDSKEELEEVPPPELRPLTEEDKAAALWLASGLRPQGIGAWEIAGEGAERLRAGRCFRFGASVRRRNSGRDGLAGQKDGRSFGVA